MGEFALKSWLKTLGWIATPSWSSGNFAKTH
jgi:hypothetical protein